LAFEITPAMRDYLAAFDRHLLAPSAVEEGRARARMHRHLRVMVREAGHDPDDFLYRARPSSGPYYSARAA
jgi:hypothetical protein